MTFAIRVINPRLLCTKFMVEITRHKALEEQIKKQEMFLQERLDFMAAFQVNCQHSLQYKFHIEMEANNR